jgi:hypothetical protein
MSANTSEKARIAQLLSAYGPDDPPRLPLEFGDLLSLLWRLDQSAGDQSRASYYRQCALALAEGLGLKSRSLYRLIDVTPPGELYHHLPNAPYRATSHLIDAVDRKAAIRQLVSLRMDVLRIGTYQELWGVSWPGSGIMDTNLRERVFAILFTALEGQYQNFGRLLLVLDIVLADLLLGMGHDQAIELADLIAQYRYPAFNDPKVRAQFYAGA